MDRRRVFILYIYGLCCGVFVWRGEESSAEDDPYTECYGSDWGDRNTRSFSDPLAAAGITIGDLIGTLDRAKEDERVSGLLVSLDNAGMELSHIQELRAAIKRFRDAGKFAYIYTASFSDLGAG